MVRLMDKKSLLIGKLANAVDKLAVNAIPLKKWDGVSFGDQSYGDYPGSLEAEGLPDLSNETTCLIPQVLLLEMCNILSELENHFTEL